MDRGRSFAGNSGSINLAYAPDATAWSPNAHWMYNLATAANGTGSYIWNTANVAAGTYYLSGYSGMPRPGSRCTASSQHADRHSRTDSFALSTPSPLTYTAGQNVTIQWTGGISRRAQRVDQPGLRAQCYRLEPQRALDVQRGHGRRRRGNYIWNTAGIAAGTYYLSGYSGMPRPDEPVYSELDSTPIVIT